MSQEFSYSVIQILSFTLPKTVLNKLRNHVKFFAKYPNIIFK